MKANKMRVLLIADIHANWAALKQLKCDYEVCLFLGDLVDYGVSPVRCINWVQDHVSIAIRGNHDHSTAQRIIGKGDFGLRRLAAVTRDYNWETLSKKELKFLSRLPVTERIELDGLRYHLVHATPFDPLDHYLKEDAERWAAVTKDLETDLVCVGHSHIPFELQTPHCKVVNPGSIGQPRDGDPRSSYAIVDNGEISFHRFEYDIDEVLFEMQQKNFPEWSIKMQDKILKTGGKVSKEELEAIALTYGG